LGDLANNSYFGAASRALEKIWGQKPMYTREGGSIPILSKLEETLNVKSLILPIGLSSDNAHLPNERVSLQALLKGMEVFREIFSTSE
jgi:acetylornithine deacetylase/succinyl-diaminopimelate desuccinylase-like protein